MGMVTVTLATFSLQTQENGATLMEMELATMVMCSRTTAMRPLIQTGMALATMVIPSRTTATRLQIQTGMVLAITPMYSQKIPKKVPILTMTA